MIPTDEVLQKLARCRLKVYQKGYFTSDIMNRKKIIFWGTGNIASTIINNHPDLEVDFFIDNYPRDSYFCGKKVNRPQADFEWKNYFVVVATMAYQSIKTQLESYGCVEHEDFSDYRDYLGIKKRTMFETIKFIDEFITENPQYKHANMIGGHIFTGRKASDLIDFFSRFIATHVEEKYVCLAHSTSLSEEEGTDLLGSPFISFPDAVGWLGFYREKVDIKREILEMSCFNLSEDEKKQAEDLQDYYAYKNRELSIEICGLIIKFYKEVLTILQPKKILIGTDLRPEYRLLLYCANKMNIPSLFWEYGWIPGTIMFEQWGNAGRSRFAKDRTFFIEQENNYTQVQLDNIKKYIINNRIDTGIFNKTPGDIQELKKIDPTKKTVFLIGSNSEDTVNPDTVFYEKNVSSIFRRTDEIICELNRICKSKGYNFVYKPHPGTSTLKEINKDEINKSIIVVKDYPIDDLISLCDVAISQYSAVDCKVLLHEKPLIRYGKSILNFAECSYELRDEDSLEAILDTAISRGVTNEQKHNFDILLGKLLSNNSWDNQVTKDISYGRELKDDFFDLCIM